MELQRNKMELEKAKTVQEMRLRGVDLAKRGREGSHDSFEVSKQARLVPKFEEAMYLSLPPTRHDLTQAQKPEGQLKWG